jgi:hypothetical protein
MSRRRDFDEDKDRTIVTISDFGGQANVGEGLDKFRELFLGRCLSCGSISYER